MAKFGQSVRRVEDQRFITGNGRYTDDISLPGQAYGFVLRSPTAHAKIKSIDTAAAKKAPGVLAVITGHDLVAAGSTNNLPCLIPMKNVDGTDRADPGRPILVTDKVLHVGDHVAFIVAETLAQAKDAAELVEIDYEQLPAIADTAAAAKGGPKVHDGTPSNVCFEWAQGDKDGVDAAFKSAAKTVSIDILNNRVVANAMEPRACVAEWDAGEGKLNIHVCTQGGWMFKDMLANQVLKVPDDKVRVITPDVGGGFGMKAFFYQEYALAAFAARHVKRPVKWTGERSETFLADVMGRDHVTTAEAAFDANNKFLALRVHTIANMGAYLSMFAPYIPTWAAVKVLPGVYDIPKMHYGVTGVFTHTTPVDAYRGAGRPESIYVLERLMDAAAEKLGVDKLELRRQNFIKPSQFPYKTAADEVYDSGDFNRVLDAALAKADWNGVAARKQKSTAAGKYRGIGLCYYIESTMGDPTENAKVEFENDGTVSVWVGTQSNGQGHETAYAQIFSESLSIPMEKIRIKQGDTDKVKIGGGTGGSRSLTAQGTALQAGAKSVIEKGMHYAALELETSIADIAYVDGAFAVKGTDRKVDLFTLAAKAKSMKVEGVEGGLDTDVSIKLDAWTFPNGAHIAEVEIDPETGITTIDRYTVVDDFGRVLNPMLVAGQVHGGVVQGIGQALLENTVYGENGQLLAGSFMDYTMPRADNVPSFDTGTVEVLCKNNEMGIKGCGEAGSVGACAAVMNAIVDALKPLGVKNVDMPATPLKMWETIRAAKLAKAA